MSRVILDSFSGQAAELRGTARTNENVLTALAKHPRVSTWDMSEHCWLRYAIADLEKRGLIVEDKAEPYPWHRFNVIGDCP